MKYLRNTGQRIGKTITYGIFALKLAWHAGPLLLCGLVILMLLQALLPSLELVLTKLVIDRALFDIAAVGSPGALALAFPLVFWIILAAAALVLGNFLQPFTSTLQSLAGDRTSGYR
ncbi:MAG: hypothetical protein IMW89_19740 [Ktedonobacteraceae bacterium]|nr:hypothetical protein [Ktedonobacteraceae bacterium]